MNDDVRQPGLAVQALHAMYVPPMELADKRQATVHTDLTLQKPYMQLGTREQTNVPPSEVQEINVTTAMAMCKVHIHPFVATTWKWNQWHYDFEVAMKGADILITFLKQGGLQFCLATLMICPETHMKRLQGRDVAISISPGAN